MPGAILGALAAVLGKRSAEYKRLSEDYRKDVEFAVATALVEIVNDELHELQADLTAMMNVDVTATDEFKELYKLKLKQQVANDIVSKARVKIAQELHELLTPPTNS